MSEAEDRFRALFEGEFGFVCRTLRRLGVRDADLGDVAQELFISVHDRIGDFDTTRAPKPWLASFAMRFAANYRRLSRHRVRALGDDAMRVAAPASDGAREARDLVQRGLDRLSEERRAVLVLHDLEGLGAPEIAASLEVPLNTVYSRIRLAREDFRSALGELEGAAS